MEKLNNNEKVVYDNVSVCFCRLVHCVRSKKRDLFLRLPLCLVGLLSLQEETTKKQEMGQRRVVLFHIRIKGERDQWFAHVN